MAHKKREVAHPDTWWRHLDSGRMNERPDEQTENNTAFTPQHSVVAPKLQVLLLHNAGVQPNSILHASEC